MRFLPPDDDVEIYETVFEQDLLGREKASKALSKLLEEISDPIVVALDGRWGSGKTYFLKRWVAAHSKVNGGAALTVYFDAFQSDYGSDPLVALLGAISSRIPKQGQSKLKAAQRIAFGLIRPTARVGLALAAAGGSALVDELWDQGLKALGDEAEQALDEFWKRERGRQAAMEEFRNAIEALTTSGQDGVDTRLVIVVDELDRCRPDYALEVLEVVKHFFTVKNVHFILGTNVEALENTVKVRYGAQIDATTYLQKFISLSMSLPDHIGDHERTPSFLKYAMHVGQQMEIPKNFLNEVVEQLSMIRSSTPISVRDVGKILSYVSLLPSKAVDSNNFAAWQIATATLVITRVIRPGMFDKLASATISEHELENYFGATRERISRTLENGEYNPDYKHPVMVRYFCWKYICRNGVSDGSDNWSDLSGLFGHFGGTHNPKRIPSAVAEDWLNYFRIS